MTPINVEKVSLSFKKFTNTVFLVGIAVAIVKIAFVLNDKRKVNENVRREMICPSLLSISRSARDTLIVMKAETLCNRYVLDSLK